MIRRSLLPLVALALLLSVGCGNFQLFSSHTKEVYGNDDNKRRIAALEARVNALEAREGMIPPPPPAAPRPPIQEHADER